MISGAKIAIFPLLRKRKTLFLLPLANLIRLYAPLSLYVLLLQKHIRRIGTFRKNHNYLLKLANASKSYLHKQL